ncbi:MAG: pyrroline-5-carboxylate reductase [Treponema sp.]|jgi:pyrroline-5-carboxylate reductase|nr:pyrroline-5-carboxylate reductase [Treponema sp.]
MSNIVCIGSGNMGFALMKGASGSGTVNGANIYFTDADIEKAKSASVSLNANIVKTNTEAAEKGDFIFLAIKPQILAQVLAEIAPAAQKRLSGGNPPVFVSMAAGWSIDKIQTTLGAKLPVVRTMPNTPSLIGKGTIIYAVSPEVSEKNIKTLEKILGGAGIADKLEEKYLDAVTGLSGSGPAFGYLFIDALAEGGVKAGIPKDKALQYAAQTVLGAAAMIQETGKQPQELIDMVTSPGGTTLAGLSVLKDCAFKETVIKAVEAAWKRAVELGN